MDETDIAVKVNDGEVTLTGFAKSYLEKYQAEIATRRIKGVTAVANDIEVTTLAGAPTDPEIARAAVEALKMELPLTWEQIKPVVKQGHVGLEGTVEWHYQRERAESAIRRCGARVRSWAECDQAQRSAWSAPGVTNVHNELTVRS